MNQFVLPFAAIACVVLVGISLSLLALARARALLREVERRDSAGLKEWETALHAMSEDLSGLGAQLGDIQRQAPVPPSAVCVRPGLNLSTRSQAVSMYRKGESPERIAMALEVPLQEVDLLLKVHRIGAGNP